MFEIAFTHPKKKANNERKNNPTNRPPIRFYSRITKYLQEAKACGGGGDGDSDVVWGVGKAEKKINIMLSYS